MMKYYFVALVEFLIFSYFFIIMAMVTSPFVGIENLQNSHSLRVYYCYCKSHLMNYNQCYLNWIFSLIGSDNVIIDSFDFGHHFDTLNQTLQVFTESIDFEVSFHFICFEIHSGVHNFVAD